jgi:hypothetical protein
MASCRAFTTARSKPRRWVPPCTLRIVLVKHSTERSYPVPQRRATSTSAARSTLDRMTPFWSAAFSW